MKQIKKGSTIKAFDFDEFMRKNGLATDENNKESGIADKPMSFIPMPKAFEDAIKLPGFPMGYMSIITGWSNTGKSTLISCLIASCVKNGIIPIIYDTENNFDFKYAVNCGLNAKPIYGMKEYEVVDEETGEINIEEREDIVDWKGKFVYLNSKRLAKKYGNNNYATGKQESKYRTEAVIEDIAYSINDFIEQQENGDIQMPLCFIWDSVGSISSYKSYTSKVGNNMFDAGALSAAFNSILNNKIPSSRKTDSKYTNTFVCVNKIWNDSMNSVMGAPSIELKGGKSFFYAARLIIHLGGIAKSAIKKLTATAKGSTYQYGTVSKMRVNKNQLPTPFNVTYEGEIACVHNGLCSIEDLDNYKKTCIKDILKHIENQYGSSAKNLNESEIEFDEEEMIDV